MFYCIVLSECVPSVTSVHQATISVIALLILPDIHRIIDLEIAHHHLLLLRPRGHHLLSFLPLHPSLFPSLRISSNEFLLSLITRLPLLYLLPQVHLLGSLIPVVVTI